MAGRVVRGAAIALPIRGRKGRRVEARDAAPAVLGDVDVIAVDEHAHRSGERDVDLARGDHVLVERGEPLDELAVGGAGRGVADVGGQQPTVGQEAATEGRRARAVAHGLVARNQPGNLFGGELPERATRELEHAPADLAVGHGRAVDGGEAAGIGRVEADLAAHVDAVLVCRRRRHHGLRDERPRRCVGVELAALRTEHDRGLERHGGGGGGCGGVRRGRRGRRPSWRGACRVVACGREQCEGRDHRGERLPPARAHRSRLWSVP
jgi:hypothetical protein